MEELKAALPAFVEKTASEERNLFYEFTMNGDEVFCREAYTDAEGLLAHFAHVGALLRRMYQQLSSAELRIVSGL